ncbi:MAG: sensor domain-containing diguanylate cyclase [Pseudomonadota bacterium]
MLSFVRVLSAVVLAGLCYLGYALYDRQVAWTVERKAVVSAQAWLDYFATTIPEASGVVASGAFSDQDQQLLEPIRGALDVFHFKFFAPDGSLRFASDAEDPDVSGSDGALRHNPSAVGVVLETGQVETRLGGAAASARWPNQFAAVYLPYEIETGHRGVVSVYVDTTAKVATTEASFRTFALIVTGLIAVIFLIPTAFWAVAWRDSRRQQQDLKQSAVDQAKLTEEVRLIGDLNEWLQASRSQAELFEMVVGFLTRLLPACDGQIYIYANSRDVLDGVASWGNDSLLHDHIHPEDCWALRRGRTYSYGEAEIGFPCAHVGHDGLRPYFCMPLLAHGETIGLLHLAQREGVADSTFRASRRLAQLCAEQISMAIANVRMRDELQDQSIRDALTGLFNRRHLTDALRRNMARAASRDQTVALLSIDVDHFKKFNDNYGHDAGDMVLRAVGEVLDQCTDGDELACRPGGEEFMIVLPDCGTAEALHRAEVVRERIQAISIRYGEKNLPSITASIGIAVSPDHGTIPQDLMRTADEALYAAKAYGRNRAVLATLIELDGNDTAALPPVGKLEAAE